MKRLRFPTNSCRRAPSLFRTTPDVKIDTPKLTSFQERLLTHYAFFNFPRQYLLSRHINKNFEVDESVLATFKSFLAAEKVSYTDAEFQQNLDWVRSNLKSEL